VIFFLVTQGIYKVNVALHNNGNADVVLPSFINHKQFIYKMENSDEEKDYGNKGLIIMAVIMVVAFITAKLLWDMFIK